MIAVFCTQLSPSSVLVCSVNAFFCPWKPSCYFHSELEWERETVVMCLCVFADMIVETGQNVDNVVHHELLVYFFGTLKFLSGNSTVVKTLAGKQYLTSLSRILTSINSTVGVHHYVVWKRCHLSPKICMILFVLTVWGQFIIISSVHAAIILCTEFGLTDHSMSPPAGHKLPKDTHCLRWRGGTTG